MIPRFAALSTRLVVCWKKVAACSSPLSIADFVLRTNVLIADFTDWLRKARARDLRTFFSADRPFLFATYSNPLELVPERWSKDRPGYPRGGWMAQSRSPRHSRPLAGAGRRASGL